MINQEKLLEIIVAYKEYFPVHWKDEMYKWEAIQHFQNNWDINAEDFAGMLSTSLSKTLNLLGSMNSFPRRMINEFAKVEPEIVRSMFISLFDESKNLEDRINDFKDASEKLRAMHDDGSWNSHYQTENAITTYLWLRYPDKYYIYKYSELIEFAKELESDFVPKKGGAVANVVGGIELYNEVREILKKDSELDEMLTGAIAERCYSDPEKVTMTIDVGFFVSRYYSQRENPTDEWWPTDYSPNFTVEDWMAMISDKSLFNERNLQVMKRMLDFGGEATCTQLSNKYGETKNFYNSGSSYLAKRIADKTGCPVMKREDSTTRYWTILYVGKTAAKEQDGAWIWKLRPELREALEKTDLSGIALYANNNSLEKTSYDEDELLEYTKSDFLEDVYITEKRYDTLVSLLSNKKNLILQGAPGVGKTFAAKRLAYSMMGEIDDERVELIQFHQNYSYEDFMMGYKPNDTGFELKYGVFYQFCQKAANRPDQEFFFIIDEINRGNLSKIFGELLMLIEKAYRGTPLKLAYNGMNFAVPNNVYIIGMMNTADRSLAMIDYALRRRFCFFDMAPGFDSDGFKAYQKSLDSEALDRVISEVMNLNSAIENDSSLGKGFCIGHSYFCGHNPGDDDSWISDVVEYDIIPTLNEYWFDDLKNVDKWSEILRGAVG